MPSHGRLIWKYSGTPVAPWKKEAWKNNPWFEVKHLTDGVQFQVWECYFESFSTHQCYLCELVSTPCKLDQNFNFQTDMTFLENVLQKLSYNALLHALHPRLFFFLIFYLKDKCMYLHLWSIYQRIPQCPAVPLLQFELKEMTGKTEKLSLVLWIWQWINKWMEPAEQNGWKTETPKVDLY